MSAASSSCFIEPLPDGGKSPRRRSRPLRRGSAARVRSGVSGGARRRPDMSGSSAGRRLQLLTLLHLVTAGLGVASLWRRSGVSMASLALLCTRCAALPVTALGDELCRRATV
ncbi:hypothetical protein EYF80_046655 [Liparis tanakae]|uniref:Uncharacterized protein n=1 Tax=Liparis tanakae TaxID=230148 RepID=A0A4Z2FQ70_9TELE|nr:hypothetical protein EYF80_046655 [Liparis tanakae]